MRTHTPREEGAVTEEEDETFHWREVNEPTRHALTKKLNPRSFQGNDWTMLADLLGFDSQDVHVTYLYTLDYLVLIFCFCSFTF